MSNLDRKISGVEKLFKQILPRIYPNITDIDIEEKIDPDHDSIFYLNINTDLPNTVTRDNYWDNEFWSTSTSNRYHMFDYHYMNDVIIPELLEYFSITDREFLRIVRIYNADGELIIYTP